MEKRSISTFFTLFLPSGSLWVARVRGPGSTGPRRNLIRLPEELGAYPEKHKTRVHINELYINFSITHMCNELYKVYVIFSEKCTIPLNFKSTYYFVLVTRYVDFRTNMCTKSLCLCRMLCVQKNDEILCIFSISCTAFL